MFNKKLYAEAQKILKTKPNKIETGDNHTRYTYSKKNCQKILVHNVPFIFTCDEDDRIKMLQNHSIIIEKDTIIDVVPYKKAKKKNFDLVYDAGKRGGVVVTPGLINTHSHIHMYLLRSAMMLDEGEAIDKTIADMAKWQQHETEDGITFASIGDITEQQKNGITTTLTHGPSFEAAEIACRISHQNMINAVSAVSNSRPSNTPEVVEQLFKQKDKLKSIPAASLHYLYKTPFKQLKKIQKITSEHNALVTYHMAESPYVVEQTIKKHKMREVALMEKAGLLNSNSIISHALHLNADEIKKLAKNNVSIAHLPTSNTIHKSGVFPIWKFIDANGFENISLGTDSVVSKNRLDILTEAYQARLTHLYKRTLKFGSLFKMMTTNGARVLNMPDRGKIIPGMKADLVFWKLKDRGCIPYDQENPITLLGNIITHNGRTARDLMVNGEFIIKNRKHQLIDESKLLNILQKKHMEMRKRIKKSENK